MLTGVRLGSGALVIVGRTGVAELVSGVMDGRVAVDETGVGDKVVGTGVMLGRVKGTTRADGVLASERVQPVEKTRTNPAAIPKRLLFFNTCSFRQGEKRQGNSITKGIA